MQGDRDCFDWRILQLLVDTWRGISHLLMLYLYLYLLIAWLRENHLNQGSVQL
jgi:hypothetical protein